MFGIAGALVSLIGSVVVVVLFGPLPLLAVLMAVLAGMVIGYGMSESRREVEYRSERRWRNAEDRTTVGEPFVGLFTDTDRSGL